MKIKAIVFDVDGTVYSNYLMHLYSLPFFFRYGTRIVRLNKVRHYLRGHPYLVKDMGGDFLDVQGHLMSQFSNNRYDISTSRRQIDEFRMHWELIFKKIKPYKYFKESILELKDEGFKVGLFSDFPVYPKINYLGLDGLWDATLCSEDVGLLKPEKDGFLQIAHMLNVASDEVLFVGNSYKYDVLGATNAGMYTAYIAWGLEKKAKQANIRFYGYKSFKDVILTWIASL